MATVLIVDDDQTTRAMIGIAVEELGHQATYAHDGDECVEMVKAHTYDIIFMDLAMPAKNGIIAIQEILEEYPSTKIIAMSGVDPDMLERAAEYGATLTMQKPFKPKQVQDVVDKLLRGRLTSGWDDATIS